MGPLDMFIVSFSIGGPLKDSTLTATSALHFYPM